MRAKNACGSRVSATLRQPSISARARAKSSRSPALRLSAAHSVPLAVVGEVEQRLLVESDQRAASAAPPATDRPPATARRAPSAIRSMTAMCSVSVSRSAPAIGTPRLFSARLIASVSAPRRARQDQDAAGADRSRLAMFVQRVERRAAVEPALDRPGDAPRQAELRAFLAKMIDRIDPVVRVGLVRRRVAPATGRRGPARFAAARRAASVAGSAVRPGCTAGSAKTASTASSTTGTERKERCSSRSSHG